MNPTSERFFVSERRSASVLVFDSAGRQRAKWGGVGKGKGQFLDPVVFGADNTGHVYVEDRGSREISAGRYEIAPPRLVIRTERGAMVAEFRLSDNTSPENPPVGTVQWGFAHPQVTQAGTLFAIGTQTTVGSLGVLEDSSLYQITGNSVGKRRLIFPLLTQNPRKELKAFAVSPGGALFTFLLAEETEKIYLVDRHGKLRERPLTVMDDSVFVQMAVDDAGTVAVVRQQREINELGPTRREGKNRLLIYPYQDNLKMVLRHKITPAVTLDLPDAPIAVTAGKTGSFYLLTRTKVLVYTP